MDNNRTAILREIEAELASLKQQFLALEEKVESLRRMPSEEPVEESDFTDIEIGVADLPEETAPAPAEEPVPEVVEPLEMDLEEDLPEPEPEPEPAPAPEPEPEPVPEPEPAPAPEPKPAPAVPRPETERLPWRLDKPGLSVKNIRSGISLYDRALFIGTLFKEDYALYDKTISELNALSTLDEAVDYLLERFPDWNLKSDIVYNFMMAIRKKLG
ncbi:MAG: hypothetical protein IKM89_00870 [Bacteroidales bacterium]|nr:hypothetical protein [Bacteroidales bacterium]